MLIATSRELVRFETSYVLHGCGVIPVSYSVGGFVCRYGISDRRQPTPISQQPFPSLVELTRVSSLRARDRPRCRWIWTMEKNWAWWMAA